jgi:hypothetical protein
MSSRTFGGMAAIGMNLMPSLTPPKLGPKRAKWPLSPEIWHEGSSVA